MGRNKDEDPRPLEETLKRGAKLHNSKDLSPLSVVMKNNLKKCSRLKISYNEDESLTKKPLKLKLK